MLLAAHSSAGATAGQVVGDPHLAFLSGLVMHFILDSLPHYDTTDDGRATFRQIILVAADGLIGLIIIVFLYTRYSINYSGFVAGAIGGILPDIFSLVPLIRNITVRYKIGRIFQSYHEKIQPKGVTPIWGILTQVLIIAACVFLFYYNIV